MSLASAESRPAPAPNSSVQAASAGGSSGIGGFFGNLFGAREEPKPAQPAPAVGTPKSKPAAAPKQTATVVAAKPKSEPQPVVAAAKPAPAPLRQEANADPQPVPSTQSASATGNANLLTGAAPTMPSGGFENRFGAWH